MSARLVVIDMQHVFADPGSEWATPGFAGVVPAVRRLTDRFAGQTVFTRFVAPEDPQGSWADYYHQWPFARQPADAALWDVVPEVLVPGAPVVSRPTFGKWGPELAAVLDGADELVLVGVSTDCCVLSTALAAADAGLRVTVVADACAGLTDADHERALAAMALYAPMIGIATESEFAATV